LDFGFWILDFGLPLFPNGSWKERFCSFWALGIAFGQCGRFEQLAAIVFAQHF
jgi:hypothetical protein